MLSKSLTTALAPALSNTYWREADAERVLAVWAQSGLTLSAFARQCGLSVRRLARWKRRLEDREGPRFHPVEIVGETPALDGRSDEDIGLEVLIDTGLRIRVRRGFDGALLRELIEALTLC